MGAVESALFEIVQKELNPIREDMASLQDRQDLVERKRLMVEDQKRKNQRAHHESMKKPKAEQLEVRRARDKTARELKTNEAEKVGIVKRGRGRPPKPKTGNDTKSKKPTVAKPIVTAKPIAPDYVAEIMKRRPDKKIEKLLNGVEVKSLKRIAEQLPKGLPDVAKLTKWDEAARWAFVQWFYAGQSRA